MSINNDNMKKMNIDSKKEEIDNEIQWCKEQIHIHESSVQPIIVERTNYLKSEAILKDFIFHTTQHLEKVTGKLQKIEARLQEIAATDPAAKKPFGKGVDDIIGPQWSISAPQKELKDKREALCKKQRPLEKTQGELKRDLKLMIASQKKVRQKLSSLNEIIKRHNLQTEKMQDSIVKLQKLRNDTLVAIEVMQDSQKSLGNHLKHKDLHNHYSIVLTVFYNDYRHKFNACHTKNRNTYSIRF